MLLIPNLLIICEQIFANYYMSQNNVSLAQIMHLKKEVEPIYQKFTKNYQDQLFFIQNKIQKDAHRENRIQSCCWTLPFYSEDGEYSKKIAYKNYSIYNPRFYSLFKKMSIYERRQYFLQLLTFIKEMSSLYETYAEQQAFRYDKSCKKLRQKIINKLKKKFTNKFVLDKIDQKRNSNSFFEAIIVQEKDSSRILCQMCHYKLYFMSQHSEKVVDIRNYLIIEAQTNQQKRSIYMEAIYQEVKPHKLRVNFLLPKDSQKYIPAFREVIQIGKLQKLMVNINIGKIQENTARRSVGNNDVLKHTFLIANEDFSDDDQQEPQTIVGAQNLFQQNKCNKIELKLKKKITLKILKNEEIKKKLIQTLGYLAEKKQKQNEKIRQFQERPVIMESRRRSDAIQRLLMRTQNCLANPIKELITQKDIVQQIVQNNVDKSDCLHIINNNSNLANQHLMRRRTDSFINNDDEQQPQKAQPSHIEKKKSMKLKYFKNLFVEMYPQYSLQNMFNIIGMERKIITEQIYNIPQKLIKGDMKNIKSQKQIKVKQVGLEKINSICKFFQRRDNDNFIKISLALNVQTTSLVSALINVQAYSFWHPNITKVTILSVISSDNVINYQLECTDSTGDKYSYQLFMHVFKVENKYYILQKSIDLMDDNQNTGNIFFNYLYSSRRKSKMNRFKFMLLRASTSDKNGFTDILIEAQLDQSHSKTSDKGKKEDISFLLNFNLIPMYWQLNSCTSLYQNRLNAEWIVSNHPLAQQDDADLDFGNTMGRMPLEKLQSQIEIDMVSSKEYLSTSSYYDI